jgi:hypothetical protein
LDDTIVLCMIVRLIVYSAYNYSPFAFGLCMVAWKLCCIMKAEVITTTETN